MDQFKEELRKRHAFTWQEEQNLGGARKVARDCSYAVDGKAECDAREKYVIDLTKQYMDRH